jgi:4a-hydroxytetrahydrobiopterin dehydratase
MDALKDRHCQPPEGFSGPMDRSDCTRAMEELHADWSLDMDACRISRQLRFGNYYETLAFVNAVAWIAHRQDHHPDMEVHYNRCTVHFSTHAVGGLSPNDFVCAARIDALFD